MILNFILEIAPFLKKVVNDHFKFLIVTTDKRLLAMWMVTSDRTKFVVFPLIDEQCFLTIKQNLGNLISNLSFKGVSIVSIKQLLLSFSLTNVVLIFLRLI